MADQDAERTAETVMMSVRERTVLVGHQARDLDVESAVACVPGCPFWVSRFTNFVEIDVSGLNVIEGRAGVYIPNEGPLDLTGRIVSWAVTDAALPEGALAP
jgi:hypothetical protein